MRKISLVLLLAFAMHQSLAACGTFRDPQARSAVNFAPIKGYEDVCSQDADLCHFLTKGYPSSITTLGYFVPSGEWRRYRQTKNKRFSSYLIAQRGRQLSSDEFAAYKDKVRDSAGMVPDHTELPSSLTSGGRVSLGVISELSNAVSHGIVMKLRDELEPSEFLLAAVETDAQMGGETIVLYAFQNVDTVADSSRAKRLSSQWLSCIWAANPI